MFGCELVEVEAGLATCKEIVVYSPDKPGTHNLTAVYSGDSTHEEVSPTETLTVTPFTPPDDVVFDLSCTPTETVFGVPTTCTVRVEEWGVPGTPTGSVSFSTIAEGWFSMFSCQLIEVKPGLAGCALQMTYTPNSIGLHKLWANYSGDELRRPYQDQEVITVGGIPAG